MVKIQNGARQILLIVALLFPIACMVPLVPGCTTSQQTTSFNTLYSLEHSTVTAYDAYVSQVIKGKVSTNGLPEVSKAFNKFQSGMTLAIDAVQNSTNAIAPTALVVESQDLINLIQQFSKKK